MTTIRESDTYTTSRGGTALWYLDPNRVKPEPKIEKPTSERWLGQLVETSKPVVFFDLTPSIRTSPPPNHPLWDKLEALLAEVHEENVPSIEEDNAWLDELRSSWDSRLETFNDESD
jgi:hypothetical protein